VGDENHAVTGGENSNDAAAAGPLKALTETHLGQTLTNIGPPARAARIGLFRNSLLTNVTHVTILYAARASDNEMMPAW
jgi:hypothetical protein